MPQSDDGGIRRVLWVMGFAVVLVAGVGLWSATSARAPVEADPCANSENVMRELWTEDASLDVRSRLESLDIDPDAVVRDLDAYFEAWQWTRTDICRRAEAQGRPFDQQSPGGRCLQRRTEQFAA